MLKVQLIHLLSRKKLISSFFLSAFFLTCSADGNSQCLSGTYTIGGVNPSFPTFLAAAQALNSQGVCGPVVFNVRNGTYIHQMYFTQPIAGTSAVNTVTYQSEQGDSSLCRIFSPLNSPGSVIQLYNVNHVRFKNLTLGDSLPTVGFPYVGGTILLSDCSDIIISNNKINSHQATTNNTYTLAAIRIHGASGNIRICNNWIRFGGYGIWNLDTAHNTVVEGNIFTDVASSIYYGKYQDSIYIRGNKLYPVSTLGDIIHLENCTRVVITDNQFNPEYYCYCYPDNEGIYLKNCNGTTTDPILIANNFIAFTETMYCSSGEMSGIFTDSCNYVTILHNTILMDIGESSWTSSAAIKVKRGIAVKIQNNILANYGSGFALKVYYPYSVNSNNNDLYCANGGIAYDYAALSNSMDESLTITEWRTYTGNDLNSWSMNPPLTHVIAPDPNAVMADLHIYPGTNFPPESVVNFVQVPIDIDGDVRPPTPTIGADQHWSPVSVNAASGEPGEIKVYPVPSDGSVTIDLGGSEISEVTLQIMDVAGNILQSNILGPSQGILNDAIDVSSFPAGVYILHIQAQGVDCYKRIVRQ